MPAGQYRPHAKVGGNGRHPELDRRVYREECERALDAAARAGLRRLERLSLPWAPNRARPGDCCTAADRP